MDTALVIIIWMAIQRLGKALSSPYWSIKWSHYSGRDTFRSVRFEITNLQSKIVSYRSCTLTSQLLNSSRLQHVVFKSSLSVAYPSTSISRRKPNLASVSGRRVILWLISLCGDGRVYISRPFRSPDWSLAVPSRFLFLGYLCFFFFKLECLLTLMFGSSQRRSAHQATRLQVCFYNNYLGVLSCIRQLRQSSFLNHGTFFQRDLCKSVRCSKSRAKSENRNSTSGCKISLASLLVSPVLLSLFINFWRTRSFPHGDGIHCFCPCTNPRFGLWPENNRHGVF